MAIYRVRGMQWVQGSEYGADIVNSEVHQEIQAECLDFFLFIPTVKSRRSTKHTTCAEQLTLNLPLGEEYAVIVPLMI